MKNLKNKLLTTGIIIAILIMVLVGFDVYQKNKQKEGIAENNLLKAPKEKIINYEIKPARNSNAEKNSNGMVVYRYVSGKEIPPETYQGLEEDMSKRTPNSQTFLLGTESVDETKQKEMYMTKFYTDKNFQKSGDKWYQVETATTTPSAFFRQTRLTLLDRVKGLFGQKVLAVDFYAGAGDGYIYKEDLSWATAHDSATGDTAYPNATDAYENSGKVLIGDNYFNRRAFLPFDTSVIPNNATIVSATLSVYVIVVLNLGTHSDYANIVQTTQASSATLTTADYNEAGATTTPTTGATAINIVDISVSPPYLTFTLNATGLTWIAKNGVTSSCGTTAGITCLGMRGSHDMLNDAPVTIDSVIGFSTSEETDTSQDPYLTVNYTLVTDKVKINGGKLKINGGKVKIN